MAVLNSLNDSPPRCAWVGGVSHVEEAIGRVQEMEEVSCGRLLGDTSLLHPPFLP